MSKAELYPFIFEPILKERVWGGRRLEQLYHKRLPDEVPVGESWEISDRPGDVSRIANGPLSGRDLRWLLEEYRDEVMGKARLYKERFPLLIKILDAREKLSLQVHPPAEIAAALSGEPKTELWYIAEASAGAELFVGLRKGCTREEFIQKTEAGTVEDCFHRIKVRAGDAMFLPSGRVHALGAGTVIFEIQQNSDTTYRVFDWNRKGLDGKPRALHIPESLRSIRFDDFEPGLVVPEARVGVPIRTRLVNDPLFNVELATLNTGELVRLAAGKMRIVGLVSGTINIEGVGKTVPLSAGQFCLLPASLGEMSLRAGDRSQCLLVQAGQAEMA